MHFIRTYKGQILFLLIGVLGGFFVARIKTFVFDDTINPMDFANLILTLFLAILIGLYIEPTEESKRSEKEMLNDQLKEVKSASKEIHDLFVSHYSATPLETERKNEIKLLFRNLSNQMNLFLDQANHSKYSLITRQEKDIKQKLFKLKQTITGGQFEKSDFTFKKSHYNIYDNAFLSFSKEINHLMIDINKS